MIRIKKISCKNFLSYGNSLTSLTLDTHAATLVRGKNGHGKSAWMDLLMYALYGKPYRNISKPQLVNSINKSNMMVEVEFSIGPTQYRIVRGMKPNIFDIFCDDNLVEQNAASRDYQDYLETQILKMGEKTFKQIAVLGSASYIPFMQLPAGQRRELVESVLDIEVFSRMNTVLKDRIAATKEESRTIDHRLDLKKTEAVSQQKLIKVMQENTKARVFDYEKEKSALLETLHSTKSSLEELEHELSMLEEPYFEQDRFDEISNGISSRTRRKESLQKRIKSMHTMDECPTCLQSVTDDHVHNVVGKMREEVEECDRDITKLKLQLDVLEVAKNNLYDYLQNHKNLSNEIKVSQREVTALEKQIAAIDDAIKAILMNTDDLVKEQEKLKLIGDQALQIIARRGELSQEKHLQDVSAQLLKDTGIKTAVVKEYLPVMNQLINKYLAMFDFFVDFTLDESFNEVIKSRGRDVFSYSSFSEGEKRRIDFSILMAFRQLAALKNSAKTNVLILDEIVDGAFDLDARAYFNDLLISIPDSNVIVISHADASTEAYDRVLHVEKRGDFSEYTVVE
jgi:DNA repair exonuclease SbcCD ATPase subunit